MFKIEYIFEGLLMTLKSFCSTTLLIQGNQLIDFNEQSKKKYLHIQQSYIYNIMLYFTWHPVCDSPNQKAPYGGIWRYKQIFGTSIFTSF